MADTYDSSAPDYPNLQGGNSSASNMKNSVANCKVRASRKQARHGWILPAGYVQIRREDAAWTQDTGRRSLGRLSLPSHPLSSSSPLTLLLLADNHPQTFLQTSKLQADARQTVPSLILSLASIQHIHTRPSSSS
jgi:hypothetical protein